MSYKNKNVMAVGAHPDDVEFGCSGTLCNHVDSGDNVVMVVMTNTESVDGVTGEIIRTREENQKEAICASEIIGCDIEFLPFKDLHVPFCKQLILEKIREFLFKNNCRISLGAIVKAFSTLPLEFLEK